MKIRITNGRFTIRRANAYDVVKSDNMSYDDTEIQYIDDSFISEWVIHEFKTISNEISTITFTMISVWGGDRYTTIYAVYPEENVVRVTKHPGNPWCTIS